MAFDWNQAKLAGTGRRNIFADIPPAREPTRRFPFAVNEPGIGYMDRMSLVEFVRACAPEACEDTASPLRAFSRGEAADHTVAPRQPR